MAKYVVLVTWTEQGAKAAADTVQRAERVGQLAEQLGGRMELLLWTMGRYDLVGVMDMPSNEAFAALALQVGMTGATRTESLRAFTADEVAGILQQVG
jgi:uncharacterized protein with GYD domain